MVLHHGMAWRAQRADKRAGHRGKTTVFLWGGGAPPPWFTVILPAG